MGRWAITLEALHAMLHRRLKPLVAHMPTAFRPLMHRILYNCRQDEDGLVTYKTCIQAVRFVRARSARISFSQLTYFVTHSCIRTQVRDATTGPDVVRRDALEEPLDEVLSSIGLGDKKEECRSCQSDCTVCLR